MTDHPFDEIAVEAAAKAIFIVRWPIEYFKDHWEKASVWEQEEFRMQGRAALTAACNSMKERGKAEKSYDNLRSILAASPSASTGKDGVVERVARAISPEWFTSDGSQPPLMMPAAPAPEPDKPQDYDLMRVELEEAHKRIDRLEAFLNDFDPTWKQRKLL